MTTDRGPNTAELRGAMPSGRTMGKRASEDPGAAPLGTDDEAAGTPPRAADIEMAMRHEAVQRPVAPVQRHVAPGVGLLILAAFVVAAILWLAFA